MSRPQRSDGALDEPLYEPDAPLAGARAVFFDLDGCLWFGDAPAAGAVALVEEVRASGRRVGFVSNISSGRGRDVAAKLQRLGFTADPAEVVVPIDALREHPRLAERPPTLVVGNATVVEAVAAITRVTRDPEEAELVVLSRDRELRYDTLADALQPLLRGAPLLSLNADVRVPVVGGRIVPGAGAIAAALEAAAGIRTEVVGKPSPSFFRAALHRFDLRASETVMVGDTLDADVAGGNAAGMTTVFVGSDRASALEPPPVPAYAIADVRDLGTLLWGTAGARPTG